jgi:hypothetical protein
LAYSTERRAAVLRKLELILLGFRGHPEASFNRMREFSLGGATKGTNESKPRVA